YNTNLSINDQINFYAGNFPASRPSTFISNIIVVGPFDNIAGFTDFQIAHICNNKKAIRLLHPNNRIYINNLRNNVAITYLIIFNCLITGIILYNKIILFIS